MTEMSMQLARQLFSFNTAYYRQLKGGNIPPEECAKLLELHRDMPLLDETRQQLTWQLVQHSVVQVDA
jgi:hypothetical protein